MTNLPPVAILCGGLGTRLAPLTDNLPKSLVEVAGKPFLAWQLELLLQAGIVDVVLCIGHLGDDIADFIHSGRPWGLNVRYSEDGWHQKLGTAGALRKALPLLGDKFFVLYGDSYLPGVDYQWIYEMFNNVGKPALMTVKRNEDRRHQNNVNYWDEHIYYYNKSRQTPSMHHIDYGLSVFTVEALLSMKNPDLADVCRRLSEKGWLAGYEVTSPMLGIGNHESLAEMREYMEKQKA